MDTNTRATAFGADTLEAKLMAFAHELPGDERERLLALLDRAASADASADVQGYAWGGGWRARYALFAATLVAVPVAATSATDAEACGTAVFRVTDSNTQVVAQAEDMLVAGHFQAAATKALTAYPALRVVHPGTLPLGDRSLRIVALAAVRSDGAITGGGFAASNAQGRAANLEWAVSTLRALNAQHPNNPSYQTDLGEALAKLPAHHAEAAKLLGDLAAKDLLTSAQGYAALAKLRAAAGDAAGRDEALARCEAMTQKGVVCVAPAATPAAGQT